MVLLKSENLPMGMVAPDFTNLPGIDGRQYSLNDFNSELLVIIFMCVHCPYVQAIETQLIRLQQLYDISKVHIVAINPNDENRYPEDSLDGMTQRAQEIGYGKIVYLRDNSQQVAKAYGAVCTPDIYLFDKNRSLAYHGRVEEVPLAIEKLLAGETPSENQIPSQGCSIKWL